MPARDLFHNAVVVALVKDGWTITHDPFHMSFGNTDVYTDLGAERPIAAEKGNERIAVEIKSFVGPSDVRELELAIGQFVLYRYLLRSTEPDREMFLALPETTYRSSFQDSVSQSFLKDIGVRLFTFDPIREEIVQWLR